MQHSFLTSKELHTFMAELSGDEIEKQLNSRLKTIKKFIILLKEK
jgi:hypothetical protein